VSCACQPGMCACFSMLQWLYRAAHQHIDYCARLSCVKDALLNQRELDWHACVVVCVRPSTPWQLCLQCGCCVAQLRRQLWQLLQQPREQGVWPPETKRAAQSQDHVAMADKQGQHTHTMRHCMRPQFDRNPTNKKNSCTGATHVMCIHAKQPTGWQLLYQHLVFSKHCL
jgi:hypothetical protein